MPPEIPHFHSPRRAKSTTSVQSPKHANVDGLMGNPYETRQYRFSRLRAASIHLKYRIPNKPGQPDNRRDLRNSRLRELYAGYLATMEPGVTHDPRVEQLKQALIDIGHPDFVYERSINDKLNDADKMSIDSFNNVSECNNQNDSGAKQSIKDDFSIPFIKSEAIPVPIKTEGDLGQFPGCAAWEQRFWEPPYPPNYPVPIKVSSGLCQYSVNSDEQTHGAAYVSAGDGTFRPFSREAALEEYFLSNPIQDPEVALQAFRDKYQKDLHPFDYGDDTDDKVLMCICLKYDDGREYIECDNTYNCLKRWYHPECLGMPKNLIPTAGEKWFCPDCLKEGRLGAKPYAKMAAFYAKSTVKNIVKNVVQDDGEREIKPWTADALKSANVDALRDLGISSLDEAKTTLLDRSTQPIGPPVTPPSSHPVVINGTVVRQPNKHSWTVDEDLVLVACVKELYNAGLSGQPLWDAIEPKLKARNVDRNMGAARNRWMRGLREEYRIDERRKKNANKLTTAIQVAKVDRDPNSNRKKRYTVSRKADDPAGHVQTQNALTIGDSPVIGLGSGAGAEAGARDGVGIGSGGGYPQRSYGYEQENGEEAVKDQKSKANGKTAIPLRTRVSAFSGSGPASPTPRGRRVLGISRGSDDDDDDDDSNPDESDDDDDDDDDDDSEDEDFAPTRVLRKRH